MKPPHLLSKSDSVLKYLAPVFTLTVLHRISYTKELVPYLYGTVSISTVFLPLCYHYIV